LAKMASIDTINAIVRLINQSALVARTLPAGLKSPGFRFDASEILIPEDCKTRARSARDEYSA